jgi:hypothetical protein
MVVLAALTSTGVRAAASPQVAAGGPFSPSTLLGLPAGTIYVAAGPSAISLNLWSETRGGASRELTHNPVLYGISNFSASAAGIVMADAISGTDEMERLTSRGAIPISYGGQGHGDDPQISSSGEIAFVTIPYGAVNHFRIGEKRSFGASPQWKYTAPGLTALGSLAWEPNGSIAFIDNPHEPSVGGPPPQLAETSPSGIRYLSSTHVDPRYLVWGPRQGEFVITTWPGESLVREVSTGSYVTVAKGWQPLCFNPSGTSMLAVDGRRVGLIEVNRANRVTPIGVSPADETIQACQWLLGPARM